MIENVAYGELAQEFERELGILEQFARYVRDELAQKIELLPKEVV